MSRLAALALLMPLAACGGSGSPAPADVGATPSPTSPTAAATPTRQIGEVSGLTGSASALAGTVSDFQVSRTDTETRVLLSADTLFAFDKADLTPQAQANLSRTAEVVADGGAGDVRVIGHTDGKGDDAYNDALSKRRADAVAAWLRAQPALSGRTFVAEGRGKREPLLPNTTPDGADAPESRARNRRVEVVVPR